jgi:hypothetical protein
VSTATSPAPAGQNSSTGGRGDARERAAGGADGAANPLQRTRRDFGGGGSGSGVLRASTSGAGGVRGTSATSAQARDERGAPQIGSDRASAAAAWNRAESALSHDRLPVELRTYVRDYLIAVRPGGQP